MQSNPIGSYDETRCYFYYQALISVHKESTLRLYIANILSPMEKTIENPMNLMQNSL